MKLIQFKPLLQEAYRKKKGRKSSVKPIFVSRKDELAYIKELTAISRICIDHTPDIIDALTPQIGDGALIGDGILDRAKQALKKAKDDAIERVTDAAIEKIAKTVVKAQERIVNKTLGEQLRKQTNLDLAGLMSDSDLAVAVSEAVSANTTLIKSIPEMHFYNIEQAILNGLQSGHSKDEIARSLMAAGVKTMNRARLIASDQIGKINGRLTQVRHEQLGVTHYYWITCRDERVRDEHKKRHNVLFAWANAPSGGHPGIAIRCRCNAMPYLMHLLDPTAPLPEDAMKLQEAA